MRAMNLGDDVPSVSFRTSVKSRWRLLLALTLALCTEMAAAETTATITRAVNVRSAPQHVAANCDVALVTEPG